MEENERYELKIYAGCEYYSITDTKEKQQITIENTINLLNQQDKRIKELEETNKVLSNELTKNSILNQDHIETCCGIPIFEIPKIKEENQQLKQQLAEKDKEIVRLNKFLQAMKIREHNQDEISFAIEQLEKVKKNIKKVPITDYDFSGNFEKMYKQDAIRQIDNQINELNEGK